MKRIHKFKQYHLALLTHLFFLMAIFVDGNEWKSQKIVPQETDRKMLGLEKEIAKMSDNNIFTKETVKRAVNQSNNTIKQCSVNKTI